MDLRQLETRLAHLPIAEPAPASEARLLASLRAAGMVDRPPAWWCRPIPLWQAAAACLVVLSIDSLWLRPTSSTESTRDSAPVTVQINEAVFAQSPPVWVRSDYSNWKVLSCR